MSIHVGVVGVAREVTTRWSTHEAWLESAGTHEFGVATLTYRGWILEIDVLMPTCVWADFVSK